MNLFAFPFVRMLIPLFLCVYFLAGALPCGKARSEEIAASEKQVKIYLQEELPDNQPYKMDRRKYKRDIATPIMNGTEGYLYRQSSTVSHWLFPVSYTNGTPELYLTLQGIDSPTSISINDMLLSADQPVTVPLKESADLKVANASARGVIRIMFTTMPIIWMNPSGNIYKGRDTPCTITVLDPDYRAHGLTEKIVTYDAVVSRRGQSSFRYSAKHPYNFTILKDGQKWDHSLLGLRTDSDWLLDSMFNDASRMRNRVLMDVWDEMYRLPWDQTMSGATNGVYVEFFIGKKYRGLFVLGEKQDRQQLSLPKAGGKWFSSFFRTTEKGYKNQSPAGFVSLGKKKPGIEDPSLWYNVKLRYPEVTQDDYNAHWNDFYEFTRLVIEGSKKEFAEKITDYADLDNLARYWLFANAADMTDNMRKNMTFVRLDNTDPRFNRYQLIPWDMDASLGRYYNSQKSTKTELISNLLFDRLINENPQDFRTILYQNWQTLHEQVLNTDNIMAHFQYYYDIISESGADQREMERNPKFKFYMDDKHHFTLNFTNEFKYIRSYLNTHIDWLDKQIQGIYNRKK